MKTNNAIGYVIISHGEDYKRLELTLNSSRFQSDNIHIIWSGTRNAKLFDEASNAIAHYIADSQHTSTTYSLYDDPIKCLKAREIGFNEIISRYPNLQFVQFIDSGDYVKYNYGHDSEHSWTVDDLLQSDSKLFWSPVLILAEELEAMVESESLYSSRLNNDSHNVCSFTSYGVDDGNDICVIIKEDYDKITKSCNVLSVKPEIRQSSWSRFHEVEELNLYPNLGFHALCDDNTQLYDKNRVKGKVENVTFAMQCPAITAYPWRVSVVAKTFEAIHEFGMSTEVNIAEDLLFHTVARHIFKDKNNKVSCTILDPSYVYRYYPDSLIHKDHTDEDYFELCRVKGFCGNLINGNITKENPIENVTHESKELKDAEIVKVPDGEISPDYMGIEIHEITFSKVKQFDQTKSYLAWNDGERPHEVAVLAFVPGSTFRVVTSDKVYQHMAEVPSQSEMNKVLPKWNVSGFIESEDINEEKFFNLMLSWNAEHMDVLVMRIAVHLNVETWQVKINSIVRCGSKI